MLSFDLVKFVKDQLHGNPFAQGGILIGMLGGLLAYFRSIPSWLWSHIVDQTTISITINDDQKVFKYLRYWFGARERAGNVRRVDAHDEDGRYDGAFLTPAPGKHWTWHKGRPIVVYFTRNEEKRDKYSKRSESILIQTIGRNQKFAKDLIDEIEKTYKETKKNKPGLFVWADSDWNEVDPYWPRKLESIILPTGHKESLVTDIKNFNSSQAWYAELGIPYHRGYLFYGKPGTGKTSLVVGLSEHFQAKVYLLRLSELNDRSLANAVSQIEAHGMLILEDVDCVTAAHSREEQEERPPQRTRSESLVDSMGVTLSGLLNAIDGILTPAGVLFFLTTNHIEKLDSALIRPGRIDIKLEFDVANPHQKQLMYEKFFPGEKIPQSFLDKTLTMAELQAELMIERNQRFQTKAPPVVRHKTEHANGYTPHYLNSPVVGKSQKASKTRPWRDIFKKGN